MTFDTAAQFRNLFPSYARCIDLTPRQMLAIVLWTLRGAAYRAKTNHWAYEGITPVSGMQELRDALRSEMSYIA